MLAHWPEYLIEGALLGLFMASACVCVACVQHPSSPIRARIASGLLRRAIIGVAMGTTAVALIYSPWGRRSGAHLNPGVTLAFMTLGKVMPIDAAMYVCAQFIGGFLGVAATHRLLGRVLAHESVNYVITAPGLRGARIAWLAEFAIAFALMTVVLVMSNRAWSAPYTGVGGGLLVAAFITFEAPLSGMSMNPARTLASALASGSYRGLWIYFTAPPLAMLGAAGVYALLSGPVCCAKMSHPDGPCIFHCEIHRLHRAGTTP